VGLVVISEEDTHRTLLIHRIALEDIYQRQGGAPAQAAGPEKAAAPARGAPAGLTRGLRPRRGHHHHLVRPGDRHRHRAELPGGRGLQTHLVRGAPSRPYAAPGAPAGAERGGARARRREHMQQVQSQYQRSKGGARPPACPARAERGARWR